MRKPENRVSQGQMSALEPAVSLSEPSQIGIWTALKPRWTGLRAELLALAVILSLGLVHGLVYLFLIPPWQHYDEPNHFEYAWLLANREGLPKVGDYDQEMRRAVALSMIEHDFFRNLAVPDLTVEDSPIWIGTYYQLEDPPLYYQIVSLPLYYFQKAPYANIEGQLYAMRGISLILYLLTLFFVWGGVRELTSSGSALRWIVPLSVSLVPAFTDLMSSVNNDVGAVASFTLFLWGAMFLIRRGFSFTGLVWVIAAAGLCFLMKNTVLIAVPLALLAVVAALLPGRWRWLVWVGTGTVVLSLLLMAFTWGDALLWYRMSLQPELTQVEVEDAPQGRHAFRLEYTPGVTPAGNLWLSQRVPPDVSKPLKGKTMTVGAWMWASQPVEALAPEVFVADDNQFFYETVQIDQTPRFYTYSFTPEKSSLLFINLRPFRKEQESNVTIYYDGVVLVEGQKPLDSVPTFQDDLLVSGAWVGEPFVNLVRNASAEQIGPRVQQWADQLGMKVLPDRGRLSLILYTITDWDAAGNYYQQTAATLVRTFWGVFGWGHVPLLGHKPYRLVAAITVIGLAGSIFAVWRGRRELPWHLLIFLSLALLAIWGQTFVRGAFYFIGKPYVPIARYAFPVMMPTMLLLASGWQAWDFGRGWKYLRYFLPTVLLALAIFALISVHTFYLK